MVDRYVDDNGVRRLATADELAEINARETAWNNTKLTRQLAEIRSIRNQKLSETDALGCNQINLPVTLTLALSLFAP